MRRWHWYAWVFNTLNHSLSKYFQPWHFNLVKKLIYAFNLRNINTRNSLFLSGFLSVGGTHHHPPVCLWYRKTWNSKRNSKNFTESLLKDIHLLRRPRKGLKSKFQYWNARIRVWDWYRFLAFSMLQNFSFSISKLKHLSSKSREFNLTILYKSDDFIVWKFVPIFYYLLMINSHPLNYF